MLRRALVALACSAVVFGVLAPSAQARDLDPGEMQWVLTKGDLTSPTGKVKDPSTNAMGPTIPTGCSNLNSGRTASGRESLSTIVGDLPYAGGATWQSTVWTYRTDRAAAASFAQLQKQSAALCNDSFTGLIGDDVPDVPAVQASRSASIAGATQPRFFVARSQVLTNPAITRPGYTNSFGYSVFTRVANAIVEINMFQKKPVSHAQRVDAGHAATAIAKRYAASF